ncbi:MAG: 1-deoxy-D-xylulose-5-phosphate reductoisomerase [Desulfobulbaceae bacterium]|jgi:1-deoxy-D-xylulose-5-phosphate reductoisomerase|nr:1-deoxy-D-xylulose-5-phosphate reductoisomerase [Desulfobulbaceae bacterium]
MPITQRISLLGSTGSIGTNTLDIVRKFPGKFQITGLAAGRNINLLRDQIEEFEPEIVSVASEELARDLAGMLGRKWANRIHTGREGNIKVATLDSADIVVSAIVGAAGLLPTLRGIEAGKTIGLANKETLVMAGDLIMQAARDNNVAILPIDSEHNAIFQALNAGRRQDVHKIILTASGGPFRDKPLEELWDVSIEEALAHPNWSMGRKISIDSASLMNKGLEVIEAKYLFDIDIEDIEVLVHPQSIVHSMVEFIDGSVISQMGVPDMRIPIAYALAYPERLRINLPRLNLPEARDLSFSKPDIKRFPALKLAYQACKQGGTLPAVLNGANEIAVEAFLNGRIRFPEIGFVVAECLERHTRQDINDIETVLQADLSARRQAENVVAAFGLRSSQNLEVKS